MSQIDPQNEAEMQAAFYEAVGRAPIYDFVEKNFVTNSRHDADVAYLQQQIEPTLPAEYNPATSGLWLAYWSAQDKEFISGQSADFLPDLTGNGYHAIKKDGILSPVVYVGQGQNGKNFLDMPGNCGLWVPKMDLGDTNEVTVSRVFMNTNGYAAGCAYELTENSENSESGFGAFGNSGGLGRTNAFLRGNNGISYSLGKDAGLGGDLNMISRQEYTKNPDLKGKTKATRHYNNGIERYENGEQSLSSGYFSNAPFHIGFRGGSTDRIYIFQQFYEMGVAARILTDAEIQMHEDYLRAKYYPTS